MQRYVPILQRNVPMMQCNDFDLEAGDPIGALPAYADLTEFQPRRGRGEACFAFKQVQLRRFGSIVAAYYPSPVM